MNEYYIEPNFRPGQNVLDALTAERLNKIAKAINAARPLSSDTVMVSPTSQGCIVSTRSGANAPHPFAIRITRDETKWLLYVCPGTVYHTSPNNKRRFGFKSVDAESDKATQEVDIGVNQTWELYVKLSFADDGEPQKQAFEEHMAGVGGKNCVRKLENVEFHWHQVPAAAQQDDAKEGLTKKDKSDTRYFYIGRVRFDGDSYQVDQRRRSDLDLCDPCEDPGSSSSSSSSSSSGGSDEPPGGDGVYVVTDVSCSMEPTSGGGCCVTLTLTKKWMAVTPGEEEEETKNCCEGD